MQSRVITSNQNGLHDDLDKIVRKHLASDFQKPIAQHTLEVFDELNDIVANSDKPLILDSCCGVGESTANLKKQFPDALIIGLDKSAARLSRHQGESLGYHLARVDLNDFWRLALKANWRPQKHFLLYPNPWPKAKHIGRRWHGAPVFPDLVKLGGELELRSNWPIYLQEFQRALQLAGFTSQFNQLQTDNPITPFERKYQQSGQELWQLTCNLNQGNNND